ncbi:hypothetical protein H2248_003729 [Termitomyces sp. 'cryptogamus']|nr:hypothetical protein H2248_003729 [Termitomyces sp. 'cryptogamus']
MAGPELVALHHEDFIRILRISLEREKKTKAGRLTVSDAVIVDINGLKVCTRVNGNSASWSTRLPDSLQSKEVICPMKSPGPNASPLANAEPRSSRAGSRGEEYSDLAMNFATAFQPAHSSSISSKSTR